MLHELAEALGIKESWQVLMQNHHQGKFPQVYSVNLAQDALKIKSCQTKNSYNTTMTPHGCDIYADAKLETSITQPLTMGQVLVTDIVFYDTTLQTKLAFVYVPDLKMFYVVSHELIPPTKHYFVCAACEDPSKFKKIGTPEMKTFVAGNTNLQCQYKKHKQYVFDTFVRMYKIAQGNLTEQVSIASAFLRIVMVLCIAFVGMSVFNPNKIWIFNIPQIKDKSCFFQMSCILIKDFVIQLPNGSKIGWFTNGIVITALIEVFFYFLANIHVFYVVFADNLWVYVFILMVTFYICFAKHLISDCTFCPINGKHLSTEFLMLALINCFCHTVFHHDIAKMLVNWVYPVMMLAQLLTVI